MRVIMIVIFLQAFFVHCATEDDCTSQGQKTANKKLQGKVIKTISLIGPRQCSKLCSDSNGCLSINYERNTLSCTLNYADQTTGNLVTDDSVDYYDKDSSQISTN